MADFVVVSKTKSKLILSLTSTIRDVNLLQVPCKNATIQNSLVTILFKQTLRTSLITIETSTKFLSSF